MMKVREHRDDLVQRLPSLRIFFMVVLVFIGASYWIVQIVQGDYYRELADNNRLRKLPIKAPRGLIFDRRGRPLVDNVPSYNLLLERSLAADLDDSLRFAAGILGRPVEELEAALERRAGDSFFRPVLIAEGLPLPAVARLSANSLEYPEFDIEVGHLRRNLHGPYTAHALGYLGEVSAEDMSRAGTLYRAGDLMGKKGVEQTFDRTLRGRDGERVVIVDSRGRLREEAGRRPTRPGRSLELTLDLDLQQVAGRYFADRVGAAVALDPDSGEILLLLSAPSYDPNLFSRRLDQTEWRRLVEADHDPLQNRTIQNTYSPGSIFKIVVAVAGLSERLVSPSDAVFCSGSTRIYGNRFRCWNRGGHGWVGLRKAIKESCDVYFYHLGQKLGISRIAHFAELFGLGRLTGIDIEGEKRGLVPGPDWSLKARGEPWYPGETISVAIGQGPLLTTPLQIASLMATVANGGERVVPHLAKSPGAVRRRPVGVDRDALELVRDALWAVVNEQGTGNRARVPGLEVAGKTGTAQVIQQRTWIDNEDLPFEKRDHAWFASFATDGASRLVVVVFVEHGGKGSVAAAPLAKEIYETYFRGHLDRRSG